MFSELQPLLADRTLLITVARADEQHIRVNVLPKRVKENDANENALTTPLSIIGSAEELDRDLAAQLTGFVESVIHTSSNLTQVREAHTAAVKAAEAENKKALDSKKKSGTPNVPSKSEQATASPVFKDGKPVFGTKTSASTAPSLFDHSAAEPAKPNDGATLPNIPTEVNQDVEYPDEATHLHEKGSSSTVAAVV